MQEIWAATRPVVQKNKKKYSRKKKKEDDRKEEPIKNWVRDRGHDQD